MTTTSVIRDLSSHRRRKAIGATLKAERKRRGWTLQAVADAADFSLGKLWRIENGDAHARLEDLEALGAVLKLRVPKLLKLGAAAPAKLAKKPRRARAAGAPKKRPGPKPGKRKPKPVDVKPAKRKAKRKGRGIAPPKPVKRRARKAPTVVLEQPRTLDELIEPVRAEDLAPAAPPSPDPDPADADDDTPTAPDVPVVDPPPHAPPEPVEAEPSKVEPVDIPAAPADEVADEEPARMERAS